MNALKALAEGWRSKAAGLRERYKGMGDVAGAANAAAEALETCAAEVEALLAETVDNPS